MQQTFGCRVLHRTAGLKLDLILTSELLEYIPGHGSSQAWSESESRVIKINVVLLFLFDRKEYLLL